MPIKKETEVRIVHLGGQQPIMIVRQEPVQKPQVETTATTPANAPKK